MKIKNILIIYLFLILSLNSFAQKENKIARRIQQAKQANVEFTDLKNLFEIKRVENQIKDIKYLKKYQTLRLNKIEFKNHESSKNLIANVPYKDKFLTIELEEVNESFNSYQILTSSGKKYESSRNNQHHYRGIIKGEAERSIVALSFYNDQISGLLSSKKLGTINISKTESDHIIFNDNDFDKILTKASPGDCYTNSSVQNPLLDQIYSNLGSLSSLKSGAVTTADGNHLNVYVEVDNDIYEDFGSSVANVENYITGLFNQVATLYTNEDIFLQVSAIFIWDTPDTYSANTEDGLVDFVNGRAVFDGDLAVLLSYRDGDNNPDNTANAGGIANGIGGLCVIGDGDLSPHAHISLFPEFEDFPTFSRQVKVVTHEMGHVLGSRHTHACVWNGNNTAIDGCGDCMEEAIFPETCGSFEDCCEGCADPGNPAGGGTIMSYCDRLAVGIDFTLGFGQQPGDVIRNFIDNAVCLDCDVTISDRNITTNVVINACDVDVENVSIENNAHVEINTTGNVTINGAFVAEIGTTLEVINE